MNQILSIVLRHGSKTIELKIAASTEGSVNSDIGLSSLSEHIDFDGKNISCVRDGEIDGETPIQIYIGNDGNLSKILLLEETDYEIMVESDLPAENIFHYLEDNKDSLTARTSILKSDHNGLYFYDLRFRSYVGKGFFDFIVDDQPIKVPFEVRSKKIEYISHYKLMLQEISEFAASLLLRSAAPLHQSYDFSNTASSVKYEDFLILEYIMENNHFPSAYEYLRKNLHSEIVTIEERIPISLVNSFNPISIINSIHPDNIIKCEGGIIGGRYAFLELDGYNNYETIDTPENRLIKDFLFCLFNLSKTLLQDGLAEQSNYVNERLKAIYMQLEEYLMDSWISEVGELQHIPFNSTVLQKRNGYAEIFELYLVFGTGLNLRLEDANDLFEGHNKKLHLVYEYWCYLKLFDSLKSLSIDKPEYSLSKEGGWERTIVSSKPKSFRIPIRDTFLQVKLYYNKKYEKGSNNIFQSYSLEMRPDYSLIICPENSPDHSKFIVHFDAKYKADKNSITPEEEEPLSKGYRWEDIYRMHTYRDALLRSWGSYILYPGDKYDIFERYEFIDTETKMSLPSVGAVPLVPGDKKNEKLKEHLLLIFQSISELSQHVHDGEFFIGGDFFERKR